MPTNGLTVVVPTYEPHFPVVRKLVRTLAENVTDPQFVTILLVVEAEHSAFVERLATDFPRVHITHTTTEGVLASFGIEDAPATFLKASGKFTFQALKKIGGVLAAETDWSLVMDSESVFLKPFTAASILEDYANRKYVFYSRVDQRGPEWEGSLSEIVTQNAASLVGGAPDRWWMEYYHWFYEKRVWSLLLDSLRQNGGLRSWLDHELPRGIFENVLYYQFVAGQPELGYKPIDVVDELRRLLPDTYSGRIKSALKGRLAIFGLAEYLLSLVTSSEVADLAPFFDAYRLPFLRFEPPVLDPAYLEAVSRLPAVCALTSSHRLNVTEKRIAVCISGEFRNVFANVQSIRNFVSGVACDLYVHAWDTDDVAIIREALDPKVMVTEPTPDLTGVAAAIRHPEPETKVGRNVGSLLMFYGIKRVFELLEPQQADYAYVVRLRPDMIIQQSLREILLNISNSEDLRTDLIYVPNGFHSQGVNDQLAIATPDVMLKYGEVYDYVGMQVGRSYFNPEHLMLGHLLDQELEIATFPVTYVLLRANSPDLNRVGHLQAEQDSIWWSRHLPGPWKMRPATGLFRARHGAGRRMWATKTYGEHRMLISAAHLAPSERVQWGSPLVDVRVSRDFRNPEVELSVELSDGGGKSGRRFLESTPDGLVFRPERTRLTYVQATDVADDVRIASFKDDDLEEPEGEMTVRVLSVQALPSSVAAQRRRPGAWGRRLRTLLSRRRA